VGLRVFSCVFLGGRGGSVGGVEAADAGFTSRYSGL